MKNQILNRLFQLYCFISLSCVVNSQSNDDLIIVNDTCRTVEIIKDTIFYPDSIQQKYIKEGLLVEYSQPPEFLGGENALAEFFRNNTAYTGQAIKDSIEGFVQMRFTITPGGCVGKLVFMKNVSPVLKSECLRVVRELPPFKPGLLLTRTNKGWYWRPVPVWYAVGLNFTLADGPGYRGITIRPENR